VPERLEGLEPDEPLLIVMTVTFRGALAASWRNLGLTATRTRLKHFAAWGEEARQSEFPVDKPEMKLGVTDRRVCIWRPSFMWGHATTMVGSFTFDRLADIAVYRRGLAVGLAFLFTDGKIVEVESMRKGRMRKIADMVRAGMEKKG
jgi:hypothetical protein